MYLFLLTFEEHPLCLWVIAWTGCLYDLRTFVPERVPFLVPVLDVWSL